MAKPNIFDPHFEFSDDREGFRNRDAMVGKQSGSERLGVTLYEVEPGSANCPYHYHFANEELLIVVRGRPHLRTPDGWRQLDEGEVVVFPVGPRGAHQVVNRTEEPVRYLMISEMRGPEIPVYPDSNKVGVREHASGSGKEGMRLNFVVDDAVDYWHGESEPEGPS